METVLPLIGGLILLVIGGELLVRGSVQVATRLGVSPLVIGLTLVGFGTSMPELVTSVQAALNGSPGIAYGNIVGSNISNTLLILGTTALLFPIAVQSSALKRDGGVMVAVTLLFVVLAATVQIDRLVGLVFVIALGSYIFYAFRQEKTATPDDHGAAYDKAIAAQEVDPAFVPVETARGSILVSLLTAVGGLAIVVFGGSLLVNGAVGLARSMGISETVIGLTIVAVGTSMPELVTSVMAAIRKQTDIAFGNVIGSNIYNLLGIGGTTALIAPTDVPAEIVGFDNFVMLGVGLLVIVLAYTGRTISRVEGGLLLAGYIGYIAYVWP